MNEIWIRFRNQIDGASLRERALIFVAAAALLTGVLNALLIEPQFSTHRRLAAEVAQKQGEMTKIQEQIRTLAGMRGQAPDFADRARLERLHEELRQVNEAFAEREKHFANPRQVTKFVEELLARSRALALVDMRTLPLTDLNGAPLGSVRDDSKRDAGAASSPARTLVYRHGIEITVSGAYLDLLAYLSELEKLPTRVYWGRLELTALEYPTTTLKLTLYTLSLDPAWMVV